MCLHQHQSHVCYLSFVVNCCTGVGTRIALVFTMSVLPKYFDEYYLLACGLAYAGAPLGTIVFAPLSQVQLF